MCFKHFYKEWVGCSCCTDKSILWPFKLGMKHTPTDIHYQFCDPHPSKEFIPNITDWPNNRYKCSTSFQDFHAAFFNLFSSHQIHNKI